MWKSQHGDRSGHMEDNPNTCQRMERGVSWTLWATWGRSLSCNTMTPLINMPGCFLRRFHNSIVHLWLCQGPWMQHQWSVDVKGNSALLMDSASGTLVLNCVTLFLFAPMDPFWCATDLYCWCFIHTATWSFVINHICFQVSFEQQSCIIYKYAKHINV
jgi:hypothetical protein